MEELHEQAVRRMGRSDSLGTLSLHNVTDGLQRHLTTTQSTVMLTANVGFLAIPGVILSNLSGSPLSSASDVVIFTSPTQIASCLSIEASIGSIVVSLLLVRHNRTKQKEDPAGAVSWPAVLAACV